ncbi:ATP-binding protein [Arthrobacter bambusae]|uniref:ATP-binding protein n=1 Tax=Arthrobacter bambusae TaxID=1338426 RepID=UPI00339B36FA
MLLNDPDRADGVIDWLVSAESKGQQVLLLHGEAGCGKSTLIESVLEKLDAMGWYSAVISMDRTPQNVHTSRSLGRSAELSASPAALLAGLADGSPAALIIDQLDAVATYSGRMQDNYDSVDEVLSEATANSNLRVILVVRTIDLSKDPRLGRLRTDRKRVAEIELARFGTEHVTAALEQSGIDPDELDAQTKVLLEVPLHFAVYSRLNVANRATYPYTVTDLFARLTEQIRQELQFRVGGLDWGATVSPLVSYMSHNETLRAPTALLHSADPSQVSGLLSYGILLQDGTSFMFFHETYFDYLFAEAFIAGENDLERFLLQSGQALFRRAQTRQVLEYLGKIDRTKFIQTVIALLTNDAIRSHILEIPLALLQQWDVTKEEWPALRPLAFGFSRKSRQIRSLLSLPAWFDAVDQCGDWETILSDPDQLILVSDSFLGAARARPARFAELIRPHIGQSDLWRSIASSLVSWSLSPGLVDLAVDLIVGGHIESLRGPISLDIDIWTALYTLAEKHPDHAARIMGAYLRRAMVLADLDGIKDPFDSDQLPSRSASGGEDVISIIASGSPDRYVDEVLSFVVEVLRRTAETRQSNDLAYGNRWHYRYPGSSSGIDRAIFSGLETALRLLGSSNPDKLLEYLEPLMNDEIEELRFLVCRALAVVPAYNLSIKWLTSDFRNLELGYASSPRWAARELIQTASRDCSYEVLNQLIDTILNYYTWYEKTPRGRQYFGYAQFELITAIHPERLNIKARQRLSELERKFGSKAIKGPKAASAAFVGAPIPELAAEFLTDGQWLKAIESHQSDGIHWSDDDQPHGGIRELSSLIGRQSTKNPDRFSRLGLQISRKEHAIHIGSIIRAVAGKIPVDLLTQLCEHGHAVGGAILFRDICWAVDEVASQATEPLIALVVQSSFDDDPMREMARMEAGSEAYYFGGDFSMAGLNCTRGAAAGCIASILFSQPHYSRQLLETVKSLAADPIMAVRVRTADAVLALLNTLPEEALTLALDMFASSSVEILGSRECANLLRHASLRRPEEFAQVLQRGLDAESTAKSTAYPWTVAYVNGCLGSAAPSDLDRLSSAARVGVAEALAGAFTIAPQMAVRLLNDHDPLVREAAARSFASFEGLDEQTTQLLLSEFLKSPAFEDHMVGLFSALEESSTFLPDSAIEACERAVRFASTKSQDWRPTRAFGGLHLVTVVLRLYRQGSEDVRRRCLDVIDRLCDLGAYGLEALDQERL